MGSTRGEGGRRREEEAGLECRGGEAQPARRRMARGGNGAQSAHTEEEEEEEVVQLCVCECDCAVEVSVVHWCFVRVRVQQL